MSNVDVAAIQVLLGTSGSWTAAENDITRLPDDELSRLLGYNPDPASGEMSLEVRGATAAAAARMTEGGAAATGAPAAYDLRNVGGKNFITAVRHQLNCGSCVAFGTLATVEGTARVTRNDSDLAIDLSEGHLFQCIARGQGRNCENGWWVDPAMRALRDQGVVDEACSPYAPADVPCQLCSDWQQRTMRILSYQEIRSVRDMKAWLSTKGPLAACFTVYSDFFAYRSGVYRRTPNSVQRGGHCVCVVGYDDAQGAWICKNSWGTGWGDGGFFCIAYGECGIDASMWGVDVGAGPSPSRKYGPLYRYWNPDIADHFYTTNWSELGPGQYGWGYEGVQCYVATSQLAGLVPLYRYWNPDAGDHFYTTNWGELGNGAYGWGYEGIQCYVAPNAIPETVPLHRYWNPDAGDHFYTTSWAELGNGAYGWNYEGVQCYVWKTPAGAGGTDDVPATFRTAGSGSHAAAGSTLVSGSAPSSFRTSAGGPVPATFRTLPTTTAGPASFTVRRSQGGGCGCGGASR